ncbi:MAG: VWA domain-containing protein, partial [Planctomycetes bacterium]|nr:VWA domain-containing protein [Planctomycetota bacterium]
MSGEASIMWMLTQAATARGAAADGAGDAVESVVYEIGRLHQFDNQRLAIAIAAAAAMAIAAVAWHLYRRDTVEISRPVGIVLALLRWAALAGLFVFFLGIERHTTRQMVHNSQVLVLVDVSQSMGLADGNEMKEGNHSSRLDEVVSALRDSQFIDDLRRTHDVDIARFDEDSQPVVSLSKIDATTANTTTAQIAGNPDGKTADQINADWLAELQPRGTETRLGQTLLDSLRQYRGAPLAGVVVISDGAQNAGVDPSVALAAAKAARVPIYTIGVGSTQPKRNVALSDLILPARAFPGDTLNVTGYVLASGYTGQLMGIELHRRRAEEPAGSGSLIASDRIVIGGDGEIVSVSFDIEPDEPGTFVYQLRIAAPDDDGNPRDNLREAEMDVVDRQTRVLLFASGPMREYQFLRDQLHRDKTMTVDILLQTAQPGVS